MHNKYSLGMRLLHWVMAFMIITLSIVGMWMSGLPKEAPDRLYYYSMHKSFGLLALIFVFIRIVNRAFSSIPELPYQISKFDEKLAKSTHYVLYLFMLLQPISGFLMSEFAGKDVLFFSYILPHVFERDNGLSTFFWQLHGYSAYALIIAIALHLVGSLKHYFKDKVNLLSRMW